MICTTSYSHLHQSFGISKNRVILEPAISFLSFPELQKVLTANTNKSQRSLQKHTMCSLYVTSIIKASSPFFFTQKPLLKEFRVVVVYRAKPEVECRSDMDWKNGETIRPIFLFYEELIWFAYTMTIQDTFQMVGTYASSQGSRDHSGMDPIRPRIPLVRSTWGAFQRS